MSSPIPDLMRQADLCILDLVAVALPAKHTENRLVDNNDVQKCNDKIMLEQHKLRHLVKIHVSLTFPTTASLHFFQRYANYQLDKIHIRE